MSSAQSEYKLVYNGLLDESEQALRRVKGVLIAQIELSAEQVMQVLQNAPSIVMSSADPEKLKQFQKALARAGADVSMQNQISENSNPRPIATTPLAASTQPEGATIEIDLNDLEKEPPETKVFVLDDHEQSELWDNSKESLAHENQLSEEMQIEPIQLELDELRTSEPKNQTANTTTSDPVPELDLSIKLEDEADDKSLDLNAPIIPGIVKAAGPEKSNQYTKETISLSLETDIEVESEPTLDIESNLPPPKTPADLTPPKELSLSLSLEDEPKPPPPSKTLPSSTPASPPPTAQSTSVENKIEAETIEKLSNDLEALSQPESKKKSNLAAPKTGDKSEMQSNWVPPERDLENAQLPTSKHSRPQKLKPYHNQVFQEIIFPIMIGVPLLGLASWAYFKIFRSSSSQLKMTQSSPSIPLGKNSGLKTEAEPSEGKSIKQDTATSQQQNWYGKTETSQYKATAAFATENSNLLSYGLEIDLPPPPPLTAEQIVHGEQLPVYIAKIEFKGSKVENSSAEFSAIGIAKVYLVENQIKQRIVGKASLSGQVSPDKLSAILSVTNLEQDEERSEFAWIEKTGNGTYRFKAKMAVSALPVNRKSD